jgi:hypothetical protein
MRPRYTPIEVENRGHRVARILDQQFNREHRIYFKAGRYRYWGLGWDDEPVTDRALRECAKEALEGVGVS